MATFTLECKDGDTRKEVYEALGMFIVRFVLDETHDAYDHAYKEGYRDGHKDGMKEAATTITE